MTVSGRSDVDPVVTFVTPRVLSSYINLAARSRGAARDRHPAGGAYADPSSARSDSPGSRRASVAPAGTASDSDGARQAALRQTESDP